MERDKRKTREGIVISKKMNKTVIVEVVRSLVHPEYRKVVRKKTRFKVHDEENIASPGDLVKIMETRPISKEKHFRIIEIISKGKEKREEAGLQ